MQQKISKIRKRDGRIADFDKAKITNAIFRAAHSVGGSDRKIAEELSDKVVEQLLKSNKEIPSVEEIQDAVEQVLIENGHAKTAKAYILYRAKRAELRQALAEASKGDDSEKTVLLHMFAHKSKLSSKIGYDRLESYKNLLFHLKDMQKSGELPTHPDYLNNTELAINIYQKKYYLKDLNNKMIEKMPEDLFARLSAFIAAVESPEKQNEYAERFYRLFYDGHFLPGGRVIAGAGDLYRLKTLANCFVSLISEDNIESIYNSAYECARTYSYGGGIGVDISVLRPKDSIVHNAADSSTGSVSFMELFSLTTGLIGQSGRRGALMLTIDVKHPDSPVFVNVKKIPNWVTSQIVEQCKWSGQFNESQLKEIQRQVRENTQVRFANISLKVSDEFMQAVEEHKTYGSEKILVYEKDKSISSLGVPQTGTVHYSFGIPSKPIEKYSLLASFDNADELNRFLSNKGAEQIKEIDLRNQSYRDMFGDIVLKQSDDEKELAIRYAGDFMLYFNSPETGEIKRLVKAHELWNSFIDGNYKTAEPGLIFWTTMGKYSPSNYVGRQISSTNPCAEVPLEDGGACNLGSINLSRFVINGYTHDARIDWNGIKEATMLAIRFLDNVVTWNETLNPLEKQRKAAYETRRLGLGIMGIADMLNQLGIGYDSDGALEILEKVAKLFANSAYQASALLAEEKGSSPIFEYESYSRGAFFREALDDETKDMIRNKGLRNIALLSIAPTGTISSIVLGYSLGSKNFIGVSGGVEPIFALYYTRRSESFGNQMFKVFHSTVDAYIQKYKLQDKVQNTRDVEDLKQVLPAHFFRTSHFIEPSKRVLIQSLWQRYIDHSISSTVNLPQDIEPEVISSIYFDAWRKGIKGITVYREGSRYPILSTEGKISDFDLVKTKKFMMQLNGEVVEKSGDDIIMLPNNKLTTVYHALKYKMLHKEGEYYKLGMIVTTVANESSKTVLATELELSDCPACKQKTLKMEGGCSACVNEECGFGECST
ncbi:adenosylcobalamin-dependent ribonucleoside-diphosphate reductase [Candidatus Woesearchaeota archaeon]|nr:adenosylcobalamin-dependent ribonucleoside-diphosphate reductase [Candidatus Woesearchaeota archaeon]